MLEFGASYIRDFTVVSVVYKQCGFSGAVCPHKTQWFVVLCFVVVILFHLGFMGLIYQHSSGLLHLHCIGAIT